MAKRKLSSRGLKLQDFSSWNFIIFLTLAFILLVVLMNALTQTATNLGAKAGFTCPKPILPRAEDCAGGWTYLRDATNGCPTFVCKAK